MVAPANSQGTIVPGGAPSSPPQSHADTYAARLAEANEGAAEYFLEGMALLGETETRAPQTPAEPKAPTAPTPPTGDERAAHGPEGAQAERPAAATTPTSDTPPTDTPEDARTANNRKRAESQQAILLAEKQRLEAGMAELQRRLDEVEGHNRVLMGQHQTVRELARNKPAYEGVRYEEVEVALEQAAQAELARTQALQAQAQQQQAYLQQQQASVMAENNTRVAFATTAREQAISKIYEAALETGQKITRADAEGFIREGYSNDNVLADVQIWQNLEVPTQLANQRLNAAYNRIAEIAKQQFVERALKALQDGGETPEYNRIAPYGVAGNTVDSLSRRRNMTYEERLRTDLADAQDTFDADIARVLRTG